MMYVTHAHKEKKQYPQKSALMISHNKSQVDFLNFITQNQNKQFDPSQHAKTTE